MDYEEYCKNAEKEEEKKKELYQHMLDLANEIENYRLKLYTNETHKKCHTFKDEFEYVDDTLFRLQSEFRKLYEYCMA